MEEERFSIHLHTSFEINNDEDFQDYIVNNYVVVDKEYRPTLEEVVENYIDEIIDDWYEGYLSMDDIVNTLDAKEIPLQWAQQYLENIDFEE